MARVRIGALLVGMILCTSVAASAAEVPRFQAEVRPVRWQELRGTYRAGCPTGPAALRTVRVSHWGFDGRARTGTIVVSRTVVGDVIAVFRRLWTVRFPIRRMVSVSRYGGSDDASMAADNTSGFNCRRVGSGGPWSQHAYGLAIDVNPLENPYVVGSAVQPWAGRRFLDRSRVRRGMIVEGDAVVRAFDSAGWKWGGRWTSAKDYQHFSTTGR